MLRAIWRLGVLGFGIFLTYVVVSRAIPYLDKELPLSIAILCGYLILAYAIIPSLIRVWRLVIKPNHIPVYTTSPDGWAVDPVNVALVAKSKKQLITVFHNAGWTMTDTMTLKNMVHAGYAMIANKPYPAAPMSRLMLFNRKQDIAFQAPSGSTRSPRHRHHVRLWRLETPDEKDDQHDFWHDLLKLFHRKKREVWIGAATHDVGFIAFRRRNLQITHRIDNDTNKERDFLIDTFKKAGNIKSKVETIHSGHMLEYNGQTFGTNIIVDGEIKIVRLK